MPDEVVLAAVLADALVASDADALAAELGVAHPL